MNICIILQYISKIFKKGKPKVWDILWTPNIRTGIDKYAANKILYLLQNLLESYISWKKEVFKIQKPWIPYHIARRGHWTTIKVVKLLRVKCSPVIGVAKWIMDRFVSFHLDLISIYCQKNLANLQLKWFTW